MRSRLGVVGLVLVLLVSGLTVTVSPAPASAVPVGSLPTQWVAQQYSELLGRAPSPEEFQFLVAIYQGQPACTAENLLLLTKTIADSPEFAALYPANTLLDKATRLSAVVRAVTGAEPNDNEWTTYFLPYLRDNAPDAWTKAVHVVGTWTVAIMGVGKVCNPASPTRGFGFSRPMDLRAKVNAAFTGQNLPASRTQAQLQTALNTAANGTTLPARTVTLRQGEVVRIGKAANGNQGLTIPVGVTLTSEGFTTYQEPAVGTAPTGLAYARMGRIVADTTPSATYPHPADGLVCTSWFCHNIGMVTLGTGSHLASVWVDGRGLGDTGSKIALVQTNGSAGPNPTTIYGDGTSVLASRISEPGRDGTALRLRGNSAGTPCVNHRVAGNLITGYSSVHQFDQSGQAQWADGIVVFCEHAIVSSNSIIDVTDAAILVLGSFNRAQNATVTQRSQVRNNAIVSAGNDAHVALGADAVGECNSDRQGMLIPCVDQFTPRDMTGSRIHDNKFWTGPRTSIDIGLMVGGGALWGDHKILNDTTGNRTGTTFDRNTTTGNGARVNIGIDIADMHKATVTNNTINTTLIDGNPRLSFNKCPQTHIAVGTTERASTTTNLTLPAATTTTRGCLIGEPPPNGPERIRIKTDGTGFEGTNTKRPFKPWGGGQAYPAPLNEMVSDFRDAKRMGANTVRLLIDLEELINGPTCATCQPTVNQAALNNLGDIATAAGQTGIYLDITGIGIERHFSFTPTTGAPILYSSWYDSLGTTPGKEGADELLRWQAQKLFWSAVANKLKNHNSILAYDLVNEPTFGATATTPATTWCFGQFGGYCYNQNPVKTLKDPVNPAITRTPQQVVRSWLGGMRAAIRQHDAKTPISVGLISAIGSSTGCPGLYNKADLDEHVDVMMPHFYPTAATVDANVRQAGQCKIDKTATKPAKPLIVEEFGSSEGIVVPTDGSRPYMSADSKAPEVMEKFMVDTASVASGYLGLAPGTPSQHHANLTAGTGDLLIAEVSLMIHRFFLRNGYVQSPAGQGTMGY